ncbi:MAG: pyridoxal 5'-phosphate synthase glutaminase subunit PdxT [Sulfolobales archaeon]
MRVGVLALQGDFLEHAEILRELGVEAVYVKKPGDLAGIDALIIPGGESTTIGNLISARNLGEPIAELARSGVPIMGTCAGAILLARKIVDRVVGETKQYRLGLMDIGVVRNAFGRQRNSFTARISLEGVGEVSAAFIRAPAIVEAWGGARILGYIDHPVAGRVGVAAQQGSMLALSFHPEIAGDRRIYSYFLDLARR